MSWTDERVELLKKLWSEGLSASQIADKLGGVSRNAVIGKVHRLKLESRGKPLAAAQPASGIAEASVEMAVETVEIVVPARIVASQPVSRPVIRTFGATALKMEPEIEEAPEARHQTGEVVPIARKLTLVQLSDRTCKWPVGDPLSADFHFCGNNSNDASPYCAYHAKLAFQPVSERRRVR